MKFPARKPKRTNRKRPLRVGFDLDGVILYNPARIIRRPVTTFKHYFFPKQEKRFYVPKTKLEKEIWHFLHMSSFMVAPGYKKILEMAKSGAIEPYIITARFGFLRPGFEKWMKRLHVDKHFKGHFMNELNEQPHEFKERMIKELKLDAFVEDNLNIVEHLNRTSKARIFWIYNIFDRKHPYEDKHPTLDKAVDVIKKLADRAHGKK